MRKPYYLLIIILLTFQTSSCSKKKVGSETSPPIINVLPDCTGFTSELIISYGLNTESSEVLAGKSFAKVVAVDGLDGTMSITIQPPDGGSFPTHLINELSDYKLRFIACREIKSSVFTGIGTAGVCRSAGSINIIGADGITSSNFTDKAFQVMIDKVSTTVHATRHSAFDEAKALMKPNFIMLTAGLNEDNPLGEFMVAFGTSPYYNGCYNK